MRIFVSHSASDVDLVRPFVDFLRLAGNVGESEIFCTSVHGVPNGRYFVEEILRELEEADLIISLLTADYFRSQFCVAEVGAAQSQRRTKPPESRGEFFSLIVPPVTYDDLEGVLHGLQSGKINSARSLNELFALLRNLGATTSPQGWEDARESFLKQIAEPVERRELEVLLNEKLTVLEACGEKLSDDKIRKDRIKFTRKFRAVLRNDTGRQLELKRATWRAETGDAPADPRPWWAFQRTNDDGTWTRDEETREIGHNDKFRVGIALDNNLSHEEIEQRYLNHKLGVLEIEVEMSAHTLTYRRRF
jgi:hypothetical protein